jgi:hypothetical protein
MTRALLYGASLPAEYWSYALVHLVYLLNRLVHSHTKGAIGYSWLEGLFKNPWSGVQPPQVLGYSGLRVAEPLVR